MELRLKNPNRWLHYTKRHDDFACTMRGVHRRCYANYETRILPMRKLLLSLLFVSGLSYGEVTVTADIENYIVSEGGCAVDIKYISGTQPTVSQCGLRMKKFGGDYNLYCSALLAAFAAQKTVTFGFLADGNACTDCGCPINWVNLVK
jgi:hypothetical protein